MKKFGICILLVAFACSSTLLFHKEKGEVKYYRHLNMSKIHDLAFTYPIDPKDYKNINCFAVEYDNNNRVEKVVYLRRGKRAYDYNNEISSITTVRPFS